MARNEPMSRDHHRSRWPHGWRRAIVPLVAVCALALLGPACASSGVRLTQPGGDPDGWFGMSFSDVGADDKVLLTEEVNLCLSAPGSVEVVDVTMEVIDGGLLVEDFAVRPAAGTFPEWDRGPQTLEDVGFVPGARTVTTVCPTDLDAATLDDFVKLGVQIGKPTPATVRGSGLEVHYTVDGGRGGILRVPFDVVLCEGDNWDEEGDQPTDGCAWLSEDDSVD